MKGLALSLLRLGDLIMHAHVLKAMSEQQNTKITLLTHPFFKTIDFLFPYLNDVLYFEREYCQYSIGESTLNKSWPFLHIQSLLLELNKQRFDLLVDLTQTDTSARWTRFINATHKIGVTYDAPLTKKIFCSENPFIRYLHTNPSSEVHFIDLFKRSLGLTLTPLPTSDSASNRSKLIVLQTLTSDVKKNWPLSHWKLLIEHMTSDFPGYQLVVLASPGEYNLLREQLGRLPFGCEIICTTMRETQDLLKKAQLLVTLDTAIKHLATWTQTPIIEVALGSSNPKETGAYQEGAWILKPSVPCNPCSHSQKCTQAHFICQNAITVQHLQNAMLSKLTGDHTHRPECIQVVEQTKEGWWSLQPISQNQNLTKDYHAGRNQKSIETHY